MGQKRRRIALSCVDCRRRKVKCDRTFPSCIRCQKGGCGDRCLYVPHTGPAEPPSDRLSISEDDRRRRSLTEKSWYDEAQQYENTAHSQANTASAKTLITGPAVVATSNPACQHTEAAVVAPAVDYRLAELHRRLIELETMVYSAGDKPTSQGTLLGLSNPTGPGVNGNRNPSSDKYASEGNKVILRGKSFKTQYFGPSNAFAILLHFEDLSKLVREILLLLPSLSNAKRQMSRLCAKEKLAAKPPYNVSIESLVNLVPERSHAGRLVRHYLDTIETTYRVVHVPTFLKDYKAFWQSPKDSKPEFVVQLLIAMSCSICIVPGGEEGFIGRSSAKRETATQWINVCSSWLESQSQKHVSLINYQLHVQIWLAKRINCIKFKRFWTDSGMLVRRFMAAGLHREPSLLCGKINTFDCEMRRRLWYTILELDLQATIDRGITPTIGPTDWDTNPPLNLDDESFDVDTEKLPDAQLRSAFTRTSFLAWAAETLPLRIELLYQINSIRGSLTHDIIMQYDHKLRHHFDGIPHAGWRESVNTPRTSNITTPAISTSTRTPSTANTSNLLSQDQPSPLVPLAMTQCMLYEYLTILHQAFPTHTSFGSAHFHSRVACRYACISTILLYHPELSTTDINPGATMLSSCHLSETQRRFFAFFREDYVRAALSLAHSFTASTNTVSSASTYLLCAGDDGKIIRMIETAVHMLLDRVENLGQGFHDYWITSSALSFVHSKQSPDVPRAMFAHAAADRVVQLHGKVVDGQLPRTGRFTLSASDSLILTNAQERSMSLEGVTMNESATAAQQLDAISSTDSALEVQHRVEPTAVQNATKDVYGIVGAGNGGIQAGTGSGGMMEGDTMFGPEDEIDPRVHLDAGNDPYQDMLYGLEEMDWNQIMNADPTAFMMGTWEYPP